MNFDLKSQLDASFSDEPPHLPLEQRLAAGRTALRRRRFAVSGAAVAAAAVVAIGVSAVLGPDDGRRSDPSPVEPPTTQTSQPAEVALTAAIPVDPDFVSWCAPRTCDAYTVSPVTFTADGTLVRLEDVVVFDRTDDPVPVPGGHSVAIEARFAGSVMWWLVWQDADGQVTARMTNPAGTHPEEWYDFLPQIVGGATGNPDGPGGAPAVVPVEVPSP